MRSRAGQAGAYKAPARAVVKFYPFCTAPKVAVVAYVLPRIASLHHQIRA